MHFTNDDMKNQIIGNDGNVYELDVRGGKPSEEKECKCPSEYVPSGDCPLHGEPSEESVTEIEIGSKADSDFPLLKDAIRKSGFYKGIISASKRLTPEQLKEWVEHGF